MLCAAIDIGSNTTRVLVAEPQANQIRKVLEQRAYIRIGGGPEAAIGNEKIAEIADVVATQVRLAEEVGVDAIRIVATAAIRAAGDRERAVAEIARLARRPVEVLSEEEEGRLAFLGATKSLGHPLEGVVAVVDVGGGSSEVVLGSVGRGGQRVHSVPIGSGMLADEHLGGNPPSASELRSLREHVDRAFEDVEFERPDHGVAVGGSATSLAKLVGTVLEVETLERATRVLTSDTREELARRFELDPRRVRLLPAGVLLLEKVTKLLDRPLRIGKGGLREGVVLDQLALR